MGGALRWSMAVALVATALLIIVDSEALTVIITPALFFLLSPVDDVASIAVVVDGAASFHAFLSASLATVLTIRLSAGSMPTGRKGWVAFLVVLNSCCCYHCFDPSDDGCGSVVLGQHGLDRLTERL